MWDMNPLQTYGSFINNLISAYTTASLGSTNLIELLSYHMFAIVMKTVK